MFEPATERPCLLRRSGAFAGAERANNQIRVPRLSASLLIRAVEQDRATLAELGDRAAEGAFEAAE